jgi:hypothetical protein
VGEADEGVGGVFFRAHDPVALRAWYAEHLGIDMVAWASDLEGNRLELWEPS